MRNTEIIPYLEKINETQAEAIKTAGNKDEQMAVLMTVLVKRLELLDDFEVIPGQDEAFGKVKNALLENVSEMIDLL